MLDKIKRLKSYLEEKKYIESDNYFKLKDELVKLHKLQTKSELELKQIWYFIKIFILVVILRELEYSSEIKQFVSPEKEDELEYSPSIKLKNYLETKSSKEIVNFLEWSSKVFVGSSFVPKRDSFGGEPWKLIADLAIQIWKSQNIRTDLMDLFFDIEHNNGHMMRTDKWTQMQVMDDNTDIYESLNIKFKSQDLEELIAKFVLGGSEFKNGSFKHKTHWVSNEAISAAKEELQGLSRIEKFISNNMGLTDFVKS